MRSSSDSLKALVNELESKAASVQGKRMQTLELKKRVEIAMSEKRALPPELLERLDTLLINLTYAARENVCTNARCPYYRKCKMK